MDFSLTEACVVLEEIHRSGGNANACHAQMYTMGALLRHGSEEQKRRYLPAIAAGELRLQAFAITEPDAGSDSSSITTRATRDGDHYLIDGQKVFISRVEQSDLMLLLASQAAQAAANAAMTAFGGNAFAAEYDIERKYRETKLLEIAPVSNNLVLAHLAHNVLGLPRSY